MAARTSSTFFARRIATKAGIVSTLTLAAIWGTSLWWSVSYYDQARQEITLIGGGCYFTRSRDKPMFPAQFCPSFRVRRVESDEYRWGLSAPKTYEEDWGFSSNDVWFVPLWPPLLLVATPTAIALYRSRGHRRPGHCRNCNYNLTGNISGVCPECGCART